MSDAYDHARTDQEMLTRFVQKHHRTGPEDTTPAEELARMGQAFDRITIKHDPGGRARRPEWPYHIEVHRPAVPASATSSGRVATMEHMNLDRDELIALGDRIWEALRS